MSHPNIKEVTQCCGYAQYTTTNTAFGLTTAPATGATLPSTDPTAGAGGSTQRPLIAMLQAEAQNIRWRDDGVNPTNSVGFLIYVGQTIIYDGDLTKIKFIQATSGAILNVAYYS